MTADWLAGEPMDPCATPAEPLPALDGFPFLQRGVGALIVGPTGGGRSSLIEACMYDAAKAGLRCAYLGHEVTKDEFNARAAVIADRRGDVLDDASQAALGSCARYLDLSSVIGKARDEPTAWTEGIIHAYDVVAIDPLSAVASALGYDFDKSNRDFAEFYDRLIQPMVAQGVAVVLVDNIGHGEQASDRAKGASAKEDKVDLAFSCSPYPNPTALALKAKKVRSVRSSHSRGDEWLYVESTQLIERRERASGGERSSSSFRPTTIMQKVSRRVEQTPGMNKTEIRDAIASQAKHVDLAIKLLVDEGYLSVEIAGKEHRHTSIKPYRETDDPHATESTESQPSPDQVSDSVPATESDRVSPLYGVEGDSGLGGEVDGRTEELAPSLGVERRSADVPTAYGEWA